MPFTKGHKINVGRIVSEKTRVKISRANKGQIPWHKGRKDVYSLETKRKIGEATRKRLTGRKQTKELIEKRRLGMIGKKCSEETKRKISLARIGRFGKKPTEEHRRKLSDAAKRYWGPRVDINFQKLYERIRHSLEMRIWREDVFKRDNYTCVWCGDNRGGNLEADHIKPFILIIRQNNIKTFEEALSCFELWDIFNGRTLCENCHKITDTWGSKIRDNML